ncbi:hypothetical protein GCM10027586_07970 [Kineococcus gypseus]|uniref:hypothetical protein n=1 Tax=Kineococcus gypseus TaxID=1637102 RepID=UPI003D7CA4D0
MSNAQAVEALLHLVRVMEAAEQAERAYQQQTVRRVAPGAGHSGDRSQADEQAWEVLQRWQDEIGRAQGEVMWELGSRDERWSQWLARCTSLHGLPRNFDYT